MTAPSRLVERAAALLGRGEVVGMPTDTVYGLAAVPSDPAAVGRLYEVKGRPVGKPVALLVASLEQARQVGELGEAAEALAARHWPGPLTLVVATRRRMPDWVGDPERGTVGVRVPDLPLALQLLRRAGPLAVTSANRSGEEPALDAEEARAVFGEAVALYLPGRCPGGTSSTVVDVTVTPPRLLRPGPVEVTTER